MYVQPDPAPFDAGALLPSEEPKSLLRFIVCGSVDHGKSTLIGRLLYESGLVFADQLETLDQESRRYGTQGDERDFALLLDGPSSSGGGTVSMPMRRRSSWRAAQSLPREGSRPSPSRSACRFGAPGRPKRSRPTAPPGGRHGRRFVPPGSSVQMGSCSAASRANICVMTGRSTCSASPRPAPGRG